MHFRLKGNQARLDATLILTPLKECYYIFKCILGRYDEGAANVAD